MAKNLLLLCGLFAAAWYLAINIIVPLQDESYNIASQTVSELSAIDAPTRRLWNILCIFYTVSLMLFGFGVWLYSGRNKKLKAVGIIIIFDAVFGAFWPPMHLREVIASGGGTLTDTLHIVWAIVHLTCMLLMMIIGAAALGKGFRIYTAATIIMFLVFGILTGQQSGGIEANTPTPSIGIWERVNIAAYLVWIIVFIKVLIRKDKKVTHPGMHFQVV